MKKVGGLGRGAVELEDGLYGGVSGTYELNRLRFSHVKSA